MTLVRLTLVLALTCVPLAGAFAESGFYIGGSVGRANLEIEVDDVDVGSFDFDDSDFGWKAFGGFVWDLPLVDLGIEAGYVDFGTPSTSIEAIDVDLDPTGYNIWGLVGADIGPVGVFGKLGYIAWDIDGDSISEVADSVDDDGSDLGYGVGAKFMLGSFEVRAEYEIFDIADTEDVSLLSAGLVWVF